MTSYSVTCKNKLYQVILPAALGNKRNLGYQTCWEISQFQQWVKLCFLEINHSLEFSNFSPSVYSFKRIKSGHQFIVYLDKFMAWTVVMDFNLSKLTKKPLHLLPNNTFVHHGEEQNITIYSCTFKLLLEI